MHGAGVLGHPYRTPASAKPPIAKAPDDGDVRLVAVVVLAASIARVVCAATRRECLGVELVAAAVLVLFMPRLMTRDS